MYNLRIEAENILNILIENGYEASFVGNYPFVKQNNLLNPKYKLKVKSLDIITNATLDDLKKHLNIVDTVTNLYNVYSNVEVMVKQNTFKFKIYHAAEYTNIVNGKKFQVSTIDDILENFNFLIDTVRISGTTLCNYASKKVSSLESIRQMNLLSNGNFREKLLRNPLIIFELCCHASNIPYTVNDSYFKIINNNQNYIKYIKLPLIHQYLDRILMSKNPMIGLNIIKNHLIDFEYDGKKIFRFLSYCDNKHLAELNKLSSIDIISKWAFLLRIIPEDECNKIMDDFQLKYKNKVRWLIDNYNIVNEDNYKIAIYKSRDTLTNITESEFNVFLLHEMFERIAKIHSALDEDKKDICRKIIDTICSRPFFTYQVAYDDDEICTLAGKDHGAWVNDVKESFIQKIILMDKHPDDDKYLDILKETIKENVS